MARFGMRAMLAIAVFSTAGGAAPLAAQTVKNPAPKPIDDAPRMMQCADGSIVPAGMPCAAPPPPVTSRCPGKIVVRYAATCPDPDKKTKANTNLVERPTPKTNPGTWVPQHTYPRDALRAGIEGAVSFTLNVGVDGRPTQCRVTSSSGNDSLDWAACENLIQRARFAPAKDKKGNPIESTYTNRVRWAIPESTYPDGGEPATPMPPKRQDPMAPYLKLMGENPTAVFEAEIIAIVDSDWSVMSCEVKGGVTVDGVLTPLTDEIKAEMCENPPSIFEKKDNRLKGKTRLVTKMSSEKQTLPD